MISNHLWESVSSNVRYIGWKIIWCNLSLSILLIENYICASYGCLHLCRKLFRKISLYPRCMNCFPSGSFKCKFNHGQRYPAEERRHFIRIYVENILSTVFWNDIPFWANALFCRTIYCVFFEKGRGGSTLGHVRSNQIEFKKKKEKQKRKRRKEDKREGRIFSRSCQIKPNWIKEKKSKTKKKKKKRRQKRS